MSADVVVHVMFSDFVFLGCWEGTLGEAWRGNSVSLYVCVLLEGCQFACRIITSLCVGAIDGALCRLRCARKWVECRLGIKEPEGIAIFNNWVFGCITRPLHRRENLHNRVTDRVNTEECVAECPTSFHIAF
jgi:hypothetical protein